MDTPTISQKGLAYWKFGQGGPPVLLIMGFGMRGFAWDNQSSEISNHRTVAYYDHYGVGASQPLPRKKNTMEDMANDALHIMDELGWDDAHIVGVSMGGMIAQHLTLMAKERVRSLSLLASSAGGLLQPKPKLKGVGCFLKILSAKGPEQRVKAVQSLLFPKEYLQKITQEQHQAMSKVYGYSPDKVTMRAQLRAVMKHNTKAHLHQVEHATLIMQPTQDLMIHPKNSDTLHKLIPNSTILRFEDAGHGFIRQCKERINSALLDHFAQVDGLAS